MKVISLIDNLSCSPIAPAGDRDALSASGADSYASSASCASLCFSLPAKDESSATLAGKLCGVEHGLSLYIELECGARILFDTGQGSLFAENAAALGVDLSSVDLAVISHGHYDHAGGLAKFLEINKKAPVYIRRSAFDGHFSVKEYGLKPIGVPVPDACAGCESSMISPVASDVVSDSADCAYDFKDDNSRLVFCGEVEHLPYGITLFSNPPADFPEPPGNSHLLGPDGRARDDFSHEQSMVITENSHSVLFGGCAHRGIANILTRAEQLASRPQAPASDSEALAPDSLAPDSRALAPITAVFSGMHLASPITTPGYVRSLAASLLAHPDVQYWTMHCTGEEGSRRLSELMGDRLRYLPCGHFVILR